MATFKKNVARSVLWQKAYQFEREHMAANIQRRKVLLKIT